MITQRGDPRFHVQHVTEAEWERATSVNLAADFVTGHRAVVQRFLRNRHNAGFQALEQLLARGNSDDISAFVEAGKGESLTFLVMMMTGACNADCPICFTDRRQRPNELEPPVRDRTGCESARLARISTMRAVMAAGSPGVARKRARTTTPPGGSEEWR